MRGEPEECSVHTESGVSTRRAVPRLQPGRDPRTWGRIPGSTELDRLFGSRTRAAVLRLLFSDVPQRLWLRELVRRAGTGASSVQRELAALQRVGLVRQRREGGAAFYEVVWTHPLAVPLQELVVIAARMPRGA